MTRGEAFKEAARRMGDPEEFIERRFQETMVALPGNVMQQIIPEGQEEGMIMYMMQMQMEARLLHTIAPDFANDILETELKKRREMN